VLVAVLSESGRDFQKQDMCTATAVSSEQVKKRKAGMELEGGSYKLSIRTLKKGMITQNRRDDLGLWMRIVEKKQSVTVTVFIVFQQCLLSYTWRVWSQTPD
jgi:hypothetical protein